MLRIAATSAVVSVRCRRLGRRSATHWPWSVHAAARCSVGVSAVLRPYRTEPAKVPRARFLVAATRRPLSPPLPPIPDTGPHAVLSERRGHRALASKTVGSYATVSDFAATVDRAEGRDWPDWDSHRCSAAPRRWSAAWVRPERCPEAR